MLARHRIRTPAAWGRTFLATLLRVGSIAPANSSSPSLAPAPLNTDAPRRLSSLPG